MGIFTVPPQRMDSRAKSLQNALLASAEQIKSIIQRQPSLLTLQSFTLAQHITALQGAAFSLANIRQMTLQQPTILTIDMTSRTQEQKFRFLTKVMGFDTETLVAKPRLLISSLLGRLGPQWGYLQHLKALGACMHAVAIDFGATGVHGIVTSLYCFTESAFAASHQPPEHSKLPIYGDAFKRQWQQRWHFLVDQQKVSIPDIGNHPAVLQASLKDVLGPRLAFLSVMSQNQQGFSVVDHLTSVSTLSDDRFSALFSCAGVGLVFDKAFILAWQQANRHLWQEQALL